MVKIKEFLSKLKHNIKAHPKITAAVAVLLLAVVAGTFWLVQSFNKKAVQRIDTATTTEPEKPLTAPSLLTGVEVDPEFAARPVTGIMIENSPDARPQSGLSQAGIVFEAVTEGGITRFLALYQENSPKKLGPIRSLRSHYLDWVMGFDAAVAHVGGSGQALQRAKTRGAKDFDHFRYNEPFYRASDRVAPHNVYADYAGFLKLNKAAGYTKSVFKAIPFKDDAPAETPTAAKITVDYSGPLYAATFNYHKASNSYRRVLAGEPHLDREGSKPIAPKNVVVIKMPTHYEGKYAIMKTIGSGSALVFQDGKVTKATWKQTKYSERIMIIDAEGKEIPLNRGQTWFAVLPSGQNVTYKAQ